MRLGTPDAPSRIMLIRILALAAVVGAGACASDDGPIIEPSPDPVGDTTETTPPPVVIVDIPAPVPVDRTQCQANGPCDPACDTALVLELFVPKNTCVVFDCTLAGGTGLAGGCNPSE